ncbi:MAG: AzlD domain-containing protein [Bacillota bacterium]|nr:AzlD domain-containing protein [Bacillota bacterium]
MNVKLLILGMMTVTMIPRILPFYAFDAKKIPPFIRTFLSYIPYTVLGALILPGGLNGIANEPLISAICLAVAVVISWLRGGIITPIAGAVGSAVLLKLLGFY